MSKPPLTLYLAAPRGFCAGVDRAIKIVEMALQKWGAPVYVRHEIVHNKYVVDSLRDQGAVFVAELDECPDDRPVIFSAHGVPKSVPAAARARHRAAVDAGPAGPGFNPIAADQQSYTAGVRIIAVDAEGREVEQCVACQLFCPDHRGADGAAHNLIENRTDQNAKRDRHTDAANLRYDCLNAFQGHRGLRESRCRADTRPPLRFA